MKSRKIGPKHNRHKVLLWIDTIIQTNSKECIKWPFTIRQDGYGTFSFRERAHRFICKLKNGNPPNENSEAAHSCGNGHLSCVNPNHVYWASPKENGLDRIKHGRLKIGENCSWSKLTKKDVLDIRKKISKGTLQQTIMEEYDIIQGTVSDIACRRTWKHI